MVPKTAAFERHARRAKRPIWGAKLPLLGKQKLAEPKPRLYRSTKCSHLHLCSLAINALAGIFDRSLEGLPWLADDVLIG